MANCCRKRSPRWCILFPMDVIEWLFDSDPAIRWQVMRGLSDEPADVVAAERAKVATHGWGARLLALHLAFPNGWHYDPLRALDHLREAGVAPDDRTAEAVAISGMTSGRSPATAGRSSCARVGQMDTRVANPVRRPADETPTLAPPGLADPREDPRCVIDLQPPSWSSASRSRGHRSSSCSPGWRPASG